MQRLTADDAGVDLAERVQRGWEDVDLREHAKAGDLSEDLLRYELRCLDAFAVDYSATIAWGQDHATTRAVLAAFYNHLTAPVRGRVAFVREDLAERFSHYAAAVRTPHPTYGLGYAIGKTFAAGLGHENDMLFIYLAGKSFSEQVIALSEFLRGIAVSQ